MALFGHLLNRYEILRGIRTPAALDLRRLSYGIQPVTFRLG